MRPYLTIAAILAVAALALWLGGIWLVVAWIASVVLMFVGSYFYLIHTPQDLANPHRRVREGWWSCVALIAIGLALASPTPASAGGNTAVMNSCMYSAIGPATRDQMMGMALRQASGVAMTSDESEWWGMQVIYAATACDNITALASDPIGIVESFALFFGSRWAAEKKLGVAGKGLGS